MTEKKPYVKPTMTRQAIFTQEAGYISFGKEHPRWLYESDHKEHPRWLYESDHTEIA